MHIHAVAYIYEEVIFTRSGFVLSQYLAISLHYRSHYKLKHAGVGLLALMSSDRTNKQSNHSIIPDKQSDKTKRWPASQVPRVLTLNLVRPAGTGTLLITHILGVSVVMVAAVCLVPSLLMKWTTSASAAKRVLSW